jgi:hypothetical protein
MQDVRFVSCIHNIQFDIAFGYNYCWATYIDLNLLEVVQELKFVFFCRPHLIYICPISDICMQDISTSL